MDAFATLLHASSKAGAGTKRARGSAMSTNVAKGFVSEKKSRVLSPHQQALFDAIPERKPRREFSQDRKTAGMRCSRVVIIFTAPVLLCF